MTLECTSGSLKICGNKVELLQQENDLLVENEEVGGDLASRF